MTAELDYLETLTIAETLSSHNGSQPDSLQNVDAFAGLKKWPPRILGTIPPSDTAPFEYPSLIRIKTGMPSWLHS
jgi:hypothetical protein